jgi:hypothetical protein
MSVLCLTILTVVIASWSPDSVRTDAFSEAIFTLQSAAPGGTDSGACRKALGVVRNAGVKGLLPVLNSFEGATPLGQNWLRNAWDQTTSLIASTGGTLPAAELQAFILDTARHPAARRLAYESLRQQDPGVEETLIPQLLLDPGPEFRRDAVARLIAAAAAETDSTKAAELYRQALTGAVHEDQVQTIADALRKAGETVDIQKHFGFVTKWAVVGPFDNKDEKGFAVAYPPEAELAAGSLDVAKDYEGQLGRAAWVPLTSESDYGTIDIAKQIANHKGSLMYARAEWTSPAEQSLEVRLGTPNAWKLWLNGALVFEREEYHRSSQMDQYRVPVTLKAGTNELVLKICQNEMTQEWAQRYEFQLRICNATGSGVLPADSATASAASSGPLR